MLNVKYNKDNIKQHYCPDFAAVGRKPNVIYLKFEPFANFYFNLKLIENSLV